MHNPADIKTYERLPSSKTGAEFVTFFVGHVTTRDIIQTADRRLERMKAVPIAAGAWVSPHIVDLKPVPAHRMETAAPQYDLEQRLAIFGDKLRRTFIPTFRDEYRHITQEHGVRQPLVRPKRVLPPVPRPVIRTMPQMSLLKPAPQPVLNIAPRPIPAPAPKPVPVVARQTPQTKSQKPAPGFALPLGWHKSILWFAGLAVVVTIPVHLFATYAGLTGGAETVVAKTRDAIDQLKDAGSSVMAHDGGAAAQDFSEAAATFAATRERLRGATVSLGALVTGRTAKLESGKRLLEAGESMATAGAEISGAFEVLDTGTDQLTERIRTLSKTLEGALPEVETAVAALASVDADSLPKEYRPTFEAARADIASVTADLNRFVASTDVINGLLGGQGKRRYLVVFQNDRELRPTGGFIGSFALMDVEDGEIMNMEVPAGGSYDLRGGLNERIAAPDQLRLVNPRWEFQDANWFADFPSSARSLSWFYEKSGGPTIDGVLAVTTGFMEDLLATLGPVDMPEYQKTLTAENFFLETQKAVELEYDKEENKPKQFISDLAPKVLEKLMTEGGEHLVPLANAVSHALATKDIQMYFKDTDEQAVASDFGWTGELKPSVDGDFLSVVDTNIAGGKTDGVVFEDIRHESEVGPKGEIINTVSVTRTHKGVRGDVFTGVKNIDYIRFYVPEGSELLDAEGFEKPGEGYFLNGEALKPSTLLAAVEGSERTADDGTRVTSESGLTVFGNWIQVEPGEKRTVRVRYRLPFKLDQLTNRPETDFERFKEKIGAYVSTADLKLVVQKQAGARNRTFSSSISLPEGWRIRSRVPDTAGVGAGRLTFSADLDRDLYIGMLVSNDR